jgi:hypothetical protein
MEAGEERKESREERMDIPCRGQVDFPRKNGHRKCPDGVD